MSILLKLHVNIYSTYIFQLQETARYLCEWSGCDSPFACHSELSRHVLCQHFSRQVTADTDIRKHSFVCRWSDCEPLPRQKWSFVQHLQVTIAIFTLLMLRNTTPYCNNTHHTHHTPHIPRTTLLYTANRSSQINPCIPHLQEKHLTLSSLRCSFAKRQINHSNRLSFYFVFIISI